MVSTQSGSIRLFRVSGIQVYLHWSWLLVAWYQIAVRGHVYSSMWWNAAEYLALFAIVLLHEFGHAFASRQVGGESREILLWPFGGIAFVRVPPRPGAELWSIAAGPLVNVALWPLLAFAFFQSAPGSPSLAMLTDINVFGRRMEYMPDLTRFLGMMFYINFWVLKFNILPIYPLDGGQILRSLLWFKLGRALSLRVASALGFVGVAGFIAYAVQQESLFLGLMALFLGQQCFRGWQYAASLRALEKMPRHSGFACPTCHRAPPGGPLWPCPACGNRFDPFSTNALCPHCRTPQPATPCPNCGAAHALDRWSTGSAAHST